MNVEFRKSFELDLLEINDKELIAKIKVTIERLETADTPDQLET